ncbi:MAG: cytochrome c biogenesis CcdA family protein [Casimicrobiaceae bacterium]
MTVLGPASYGLGFMAGVVSILSPCVLPIAPIVVGSALAAHRWGPVALALGLAVSFTAVGLFIATAGFAIGLDAEWFKTVAASLLVVFGLVILNSALQRRFSGAAARIGTLGDEWLQRLRIDGLRGQLVVGLLLGLIWAPCVGPTLGAASLLASQGKDLAHVALVMALFGVGAALPLVVIGAVSRGVMARSRAGLLRTGVHGKYVLGVLILSIGIFMLTGWDRAVERHLNDIAPKWLLDVTTRF